MTYIIHNISSYLVKFDVEDGLERTVAIGFYMARIYRVLLKRKSVYTLIKYDVEDGLERTVALGFYMARIYREVLYRKSIYALELKVDIIKDIQKIALDEAFTISFCEGGGFFVLLKDLRILPLKLKCMIVILISVIGLSVELWGRRYWPKISRWNCRNELIVCVQSIKSSTEFVYVIKAADLVLSLLSGRKPEDLGHSDLVTKR